MWQGGDFNSIESSSVVSPVKVHSSMQSACCDIGELLRGGRDEEKEGGGLHVRLITNRTVLLAGGPETDAGTDGRDRALRAVRRAFSRTGRTTAGEKQARQSLCLGCTVIDYIDHSLFIAVKSTLRFPQRQGKAVAEPLLHCTKNCKN